MPGRHPREVCRGRTGNPRGRESGLWAVFRMEAACHDARGTAMNRGMGGRQTGRLPDFSRIDAGILQNTAVLTLIALLATDAGDDLPEPGPMQRAELARQASGICRESGASHFAQRRISLSRACHQLPAA